MKKTKIICTIGPASENEEVLKKLIENGMDIARLNFSHGDHDEQLRRIELIKKVREQLKVPVAILLDTKGPEIRTGIFENDSVVLETGNEVMLTTEDVVGNNTLIPITYKNLVNDIKIGNTILIDDGIIELRVKEVLTNEILCVVINGGKLSNKKGVNVPGVKINLPPITEKDRDDIIFGIKNEVDFIAASFVRSKDAVIEIKDLLQLHDANQIQVISKIENQEGVNNLDEIIQVSDGVMVARGDLGVEISSELIPIIQKKIIKKCNESFLPVITATHMLDSMIRNPVPTRAEVTDVANAIYDGTDAIMLSGETAMGKYPLESLKTMVRIALATEETLEYNEMLRKRKSSITHTIANAVSFSSCATAANLGAKLIVSATFSGFSARMSSGFRPKAPIIGLSPHEHIQRRMQLYWGVIPVCIDEVDSTDALFYLVIKTVKELNYVKKGDIIVVTAGVPVSTAGVTNIMKVLTI